MIARIAGEISKGAIGAVIVNAGIANGILGRQIGAVIRVAGVADQIIGNKGAGIRTIQDSISVFVVIARIPCGVIGV